MEIQFRNAEAENSNELRFIAEIDSKIPLEFDPGYVWSESSIAAKVEQYGKQISSKDFFEIALCNNLIVGFHIIKLVPYPPDLLAGAIFTLWVDPKYRGKGIASELKNRGEKWAKDQKCAYLVTNVHFSNSKLLDLNKSAGFEIVQFAMRKTL